MNELIYKLISQTNRSTKQIIREVREQFPEKTKHMTDAMIDECIIDVRNQEHQDRIRKSNSEYQSGSFGWE